MARRQTRTQGFSLYEMRDPIAKAVDDLTAALERQGVEVNVDSLMLQIQNVVNSVGNPVGNYAGGTGMYASDDNAPVPYTVAGDLMAIAFEHYKAGDKREAIKNQLMAMATDDYPEIVSGLLSMNAQSRIQDIVAENEDTPIDNDDTDEADTTEDEDEDDNEDDDSTDDLSEEQIQALIDEDDSTNDEDEDETTVEADDGKIEATPESAKPTLTAPETSKPSAPKTSDENKDDEEEEEDDTTDPKAKGPMGGKTSSEVNASLNAKIMANRVSLSGTPQTRSKAREFIKTAQKK